MNKYLEKLQKDVLEYLKNEGVEDVNFTKLEQNNNIVRGMLRSGENYAYFMYKIDSLSNIDAWYEEHLRAICLKTVPILKRTPDEQNNLDQ